MKSVHEFVHCIPTTVGTYLFRDSLSSIAYNRVHFSVPVGYICCNKPIIFVLFLQFPVTRARALVLALGLTLHDLVRGVAHGTGVIQYNHQPDALSTICIISTYRSFALSYEYVQFKLYFNFLIFFHRCLTVYLVSYFVLPTYLNTFYF